MHFRNELGSTAGLSQRRSHSNPHFQLLSFGHMNRDVPLVANLYEKFYVAYSKSAMVFAM